MCVHVCVPSTPAPANASSPQGTFGREPAAVKPDDERYLRAAIQEYDNIAKLGQIIREGPIKVSRPSSLLHPDPWLGLDSRGCRDGKGPGKQLPPPLGPQLDPPSGGQEQRAALG